ncbi:MAG: carbohydrate binding family 9 domain-containing protein [Gemmatimonadetes bacterium]|nr:carbohydrate binding family 9 domain-containing protein [Gemmatimonadota bacterium]
MPLIVRTSRLRWAPLAFVIAAVLFSTRAPAQEPAAARKQVRAVRIEGRAPTVDGKLDDEAWSAAPALTGLVQKLPVEGAPVSEATEVRFAYDDDALYVGARMFSRDPAAIQAPVSRRDNGEQAERLLVSLDTYLDRRTAYTFGVTASGVRLDWFHPSDSGEGDPSFEPVWVARTRRDSLGWTAEMRIPFSQLRFSRADVQTWGVNVSRRIPSTNEDQYWAMVPARETGWASRFGDLAGITGIRQTRRVELTPYVAGGADFTSNPGEGNPFDDGSEASVRVGGDLKMGLGPNLTLGATINPDFGQVELDPAVVNLSAFETFFGERRPFFTEGSELLSVGNHFYSRRIGAPPRPVAVFGLARQAGEYTYLDAPPTSTILGAAKLTGRLPSGTSIGVLGAVTDRERVSTFDPQRDEFHRFVAAPRTATGVARVQQELGPSGSTAGLVLTGVHRDLDAGEPLAAYMNRQAYSGGVDWNLRFRRGEYVLRGDVGYSYVDGDPLAIVRAQRSSVRYFQRPDAEHVRLDSSRTSLSGSRASLSLSRNSGTHWLWNVDAAARSPGFELNDAGAMGSTDRISLYSGLTYRETRPRGPFRSYSVKVGSENAWNYAGTRTWGAVTTNSSATFKNFWRGSFIGWVDLPAYDPAATRGGPLMGTNHAWMTIFGIGNPVSARTRLRMQVERGGSEQGQDWFRLFTGVSIRPAPQWQLSLEPNYQRWTDPRQFVGTRAGGPQATFGTRYVFAHIDRSELVARMRASYLFTPDLSLEVYAEPYAASGRYHTFGELPAARSRGLRVYGRDGSTIQPTDDGYAVTDGASTFTLPDNDFNVLSFRSNTVMRWEWRPGSTLFLVWQQNRYAESPGGRPVGVGTLGDTFRADGDNYLALKMTYWIPLR